MEITCKSTLCASMSFSRSSGVKRTLGEVKAVRLPPPITVPMPSPGWWRKPYQSLRASAACHRDRGTRCAWMSMVFMSASSLKIEEPSTARLLLEEVVEPAADVSGAGRVGRGVALDRHAERGRGAVVASGLVRQPLGDGLRTLEAPAPGEKGAPAARPKCSPAGSAPPQP